MKAIRGLKRMTNHLDTRQYDRQDIEEPKGSAIWVNPVGFNVLSHRRERRNTLGFPHCLTGLESTPPAPGRKEVPSSSRTQTGPGVMPIIPKWGTPASHKRKETEPVVFFQVPRAVTSTEITFNPPMSIPSDTIFSALC